MARPSLRSATRADAPTVAEIYAHHVLNGTATFDIDPPKADHWADKIEQIGQRRWPFLIAEHQATVIGYAYATQFRDRPAYAATCENSIYLAPDWVGQGVGALLLAHLLDAAAACRFTQMIGVIGGGEPASVALHRKLGFVEAGRMRNVGQKFGRMLDTVYMQRALAQPQGRGIGGRW